ncbi:MAG: hypothetical protein RL641_474 [Candidatus Parcubacteria bacterium]
MPILVHNHYKFEFSRFYAELDEAATKNDITKAVIKKLKEIQKINELHFYKTSHELCMIWSNYFSDISRINEKKEIETKIIKALIKAKIPFAIHQYYGWKTM